MSMLEFAFLPKVIAVHTSATMSPGPNFALVFKVATERANKLSSYATALGVSVGILIHASLALFGVNQMLSSHEGAMLVLKAVAALYLLYLGYLSLRSAQRIFTGPKDVGASALNPRAEAGHESFQKYFWAGFTNCLFNPKAFLYFVTVLPQGLTHTLSAYQASITLLLLGSITLAWFSLVSLFFRLPAIQARIQRFRLAVSGFTGVLFVYLAATFIVDLARHL
ncbi:hypothetical protein F0U60_27020 [Archangium minus]|uniref:Threonine efflux protein n=1 Tax=Archangium minus TaxID=83450 RepID=A0ABY9WW57_9BACT|nr:hypothetical protein F0U60_27020 [Archangium minus]